AFLRDREQAPGEPGEHARERDGHPLREPHVVADEASASLVHADGLERPAEWRVYQPEEKDDADEEPREDEVEEGDVVLQPEKNRPEPELGPVDVEKAVLAPRERVPLHRDEPEHLAARDRHEGEVNSAPVRDEATDQRRAEAADDGRAEQRDERIRR